MSPLACRPGISTPAASKSVSRVLTKITHMTRVIPGLSRDARHQKNGFSAVETNFPQSPSVHKVSQELTPFDPFHCLVYLCAYALRFLALKDIFRAF